LAGFSNIIAKYPAERGALARLEKLSRRAPGEYTFSHLVERVRPASPEAFAAALVELEGTGVLHKVFRVESPFTHGGIGDFESLLDVPTEMHDPRSDQDIRVRPQDVRVVFKVGRE
jgi:hypothetical protein